MYHTYDIAIRYKRPRDDKLTWFYGQALAQNKALAEAHGRQSFQQEYPGITPVSVHVVRRAIDDDDYVGKHRA